jgi:hypothetical protein
MATCNNGGPRWVLRPMHQASEVLIFDEAGPLIKLVEAGMTFKVASTDVAWWHRVMEANP